MKKLSIENQKILNRIQKDVERLRRNGFVFSDSASEIYLFSSEFIESETENDNYGNLYNISLRSAKL